MIAESSSTTTIQLVIPHMTGSALQFLDIPKGTMNDFTIHCRIGILVSYLLFVEAEAGLVSRKAIPYLPRDHVGAYTSVSLLYPIGNEL